YWQYHYGKALVSRWFGIEQAGVSAHGIAMTSATARCRPRRLMLNGCGTLKAPTRQRRTSRGPMVRRGHTRRDHQPVVTFVHSDYFGHDVFPGVKPTRPRDV